MAVVYGAKYDWDVDTLQYLTRIISSGSSISIVNLKAVNTFIKSCKNDGIWTAIKSCCLLCGANTLNGALTPLVGIAPTNNNFTEGDYSRTTGLKGNGSNKWLHSNRLNDIDPLNSKHISCWASDIGTTSLTRAFLDSTGTSGRTSLLARGTSDFFAYCNSGSFTTPALESIGFMGVSRTSSTNLNVIYNGVSTSKSITSNNNSNVIGIFCGGAGAAFFNDARISFYSIGESLDLEKLNIRLSILMSSLV